MPPDTFRSPVWETDGADWPHRACSRFESAAGLRWHLQTMGQGPSLWLVHGTGASTHSWRDVMPRLAERFQVHAFDLPGHGFTERPTPDRMNLAAMAAAVGELMRTVGAPAIGVGHSAGMAILCRMVLDGLVEPRLVVGVNAALQPFGGAAGRWFSTVARWMAQSPLPRWVAWRAQTRSAVKRVADGTGSTLDERGLELYQRLTRRSGHVAATLFMMADWDLPGLHRQLPVRRLPVLLGAGSEDRAVPARQDQSQVQPRRPRPGRWPCGSTRPRSRWPE